jgi:predicted metalloprotease
MQWQGGRRSGNVVDRRGRGGGLAIGGGAGLILALVGLFFGVDLTGGGDGSGVPQDQSGYGGSGQADPQQAQLADFASVILADTEDTWPKLLNNRYTDPKMVLYTSGTQTGCGYGQAAMGPFYCPADQQVYLDLSFFNQLDRQLGAPGDFAQAYVIAHEVGHHVQNLMGTADKVHSMQARADKRTGNALSVMMELQADCYAGIWANHAQKERKVLERGDIEEGLNAASQIGDDTLQRKGQGRVVPESFTHGSSAQRVEWFKRGFNSGTLESCDTFKAAGR